MSGARDASRDLIFIGDNGPRVNGTANLSGTTSGERGREKFKERVSACIHTRIDIL